MEEHKGKEEVWTMMYDWKGAKVGKVHSDLDCSVDNVHLSCLFDMVEVLGVSFG